MKFLFSVGIDQCRLDNGGIQEQQYFIKIWDLQALISGSEGYNCMTPDGLCGGTIWERSNKNDQSQSNDPKAQKAPRSISITHNNRVYTDELNAVRVSPDGVIGGIVLQNNEILIYRFMDKNGDLLPEKTAKKPVKTHIIHYKHLTEVTDIYIYKKNSNQNDYDGDEYCMYVLFKDGIILFNGVERKNDQIIVLDQSKEGPTQLTPLCSDIDHRNGILLIDTSQRLPNNQTENFIKRY